MEFKKIGEAIDELIAIREIIRNIIKSLTKDGDVNDWCHMKVISEETMSIFDKVLSNQDLLWILYDNDTNESEIPGAEKLIFEIQKYAIDQNKLLLKDLNYSINWYTTVKFEDYRCREVLKRYSEVCKYFKDYFLDFANDCGLKVEQN